jgi:hypothetical protein
VLDPAAFEPVQDIEGGHGVVGFDISYRLGQTSLDKPPTGVGKAFPLAREVGRGRQIVPASRGLASSGVLARPADERIGDFQRKSLARKEVSQPVAAQQPLGLVQLAGSEGLLNLSQLHPPSLEHGREGKWEGERE